MSRSFAPSVLFRAVVREAVGERWAQEPRVAGQRQRHARLEVRPRAGHRVVPIEVDELAGELGVQPEAWLALETEGHLRHAPVRTLLEGDVVVDGLEPLQAGEGAERAALEDELGGAFEVGDARRLEPVAEIGEVVLVRHRARLDARADPVLEPPEVGEVRERAALAAAGAIGEVLALERPAALIVEVAELALQDRPAARGQSGGEGRVDVRADVPVPRHAQLEPRAVAPPDRRGEEAGLSLRTDREAERGHGEDGDALEVQHDAAGGADAPFPIEPDLGGARMNQLSSPGGQLE